jgi:cytochrome b561
MRRPWHADARASEQERYSRRTRLLTWIALLLALAAFGLAAGVWTGWLPAQRPTVQIVELQTPSPMVRP